MLDEEDDISDVEQTYSSYLMCAFLKYGCHWSARWSLGGEHRARAAKDQHEQGCIYRFHAPRSVRSPNR